MSGLSSSLPVRKRSYRFALTPLADAMFQVLIFFMLSTSLTPYSILTLSSGPDEDAKVPVQPKETVAGTDEEPPPQEPLPPKVILWRLEAGKIWVGPLPYEVAQAGDAAAGLAEVGNTGNLVVIIGRTARIQDVVTTMEALQGAEIANVQLVMDEGG